MKLAPVLVCLFSVFCYVKAYSQINLLQQRQDSAQVIIEDSVKAILPSDTSTLAVPQQTEVTTSIITKDSAVHVKEDTIKLRDSFLIDGSTGDSFFTPSYRFKPTPRKAVIFSALFPGLGQIYNRKYWKLPILYGGFVGFTYAITWNNGYYRDYLGAYQDIMDDNPDTNRWHNMLPYGQDPATTDIRWFTDVLKQRKDYYRYYRDFSIIGTFALYLIAIVDAYVDAQLFDFDISPDLSMRVAPVMVKDERYGYNGSSSLGVQWSFNF